MKKDKNRKIVNTMLLVTAMLIWIAGAAQAQVTTYTNESAYLAALAGLGFSTPEEGFENDAVWGSVRSSFSVTNSAPSINSMGIIWTSNHPATNEITTGSGAARTGDWGIYDPNHGHATGTVGQCDVDNPPANCFFHDGFTGTREAGADTLYGAGGWVTGTFGGNIIMILDGNESNPIDFGDLGGITAAHKFFGVIDTGGFTQFEFRETEGKVGDQKFIFADDFTFGTGLSPENTPPVANDNGYATDAETPLTIAAPGVLGNDTDADGDPLTAILNVGPSNGILNLDPNGSFSYTPNTNFTGPDTFTYHANDGAADSNIATVTITVNSIPVDTYTVVVSDTSGVAISGADVAVDYPGVAPQTTDAGGQATFTLPAGGTYLYTIEAAGYVTQEVSSSNTVVDVTLAAIDATISGIVEDTSGAPLGGATVTAFQPDDIAVTYQAVSGAGGAYTISLPMGAPNSGYTVVAELAGFVSVVQTDQAAGFVDFTGSNGLQAKTTITSVTADVVNVSVRLDITADPAFKAVTEADVTVTSTGGTGLLGPLSFAGGTISVTYSAVEDFTVVIKADTSEDHNPNVGYFASSTFSYVADDPAAASARMDVDAGGGTLNLTANGQTATVAVPVGGVSKPSTFVIKQIAKTVQNSETEGSPTYVYEVTAADINTGTPLTAAEINRIELTLPIDLNIVQPGDLEDGMYVIYQAADTFFLEAGDGTPVPASQIISTDYVGDGMTGSVRFWVDHLSAFGAGVAAAVTPVPDGGGGGGGGGCFIATADGLTLEPRVAVRPTRSAIVGAFMVLSAVVLISLKKIVF